MVSGFLAIFKCKTFERLNVIFVVAVVTQRKFGRGGSLGIVHPFVYFNN